MRKIDFPEVIGLFLMFFGGGIGIGLSVWAMRDGNVLWGILFLALGIFVVRDASSNQEYTWKPVITGLLMGSVFLSIGLTAVFLHDTWCIWGMVFGDVVGFAYVALGSDFKDIKNT